MIAAGGEAYLLALAWTHGHMDPFRLHHKLGADFRPLGVPDAEPRHPAYPRRYQAFIYGCGLWVEEQENKRAGMKLGGGR